MMVLYIISCKTFKSFFFFVIQLYFSILFLLPVNMLSLNLFKFGSQVTFKLLLMRLVKVRFSENINKIIHVVTTKIFVFIPQKLNLSVLIWFFQFITKLNFIIAIPEQCFIEFKKSK